MTTIKPFREDTNNHLRKLYIESIFRPSVSYDDGKTFRPRARYPDSWHNIKRCSNPVDITQHVTDPSQNIWVWSDLHFGHKNIIKFSDRPYEDIPEMDEALIVNFNNSVKSTDVSIWVGDVSFKSFQETRKIINRLNGYKILIAGNHDFDKNKNVMNTGFDEVHIVYNLTIDDTVVAFTHYPMDNLPGGWFNVHGHVHKNGHHADEIAMPTHVNVNCEFWDYKPITLTTIASKIPL